MFSMWSFLLMPAGNILDSRQMYGLCDSAAFVVITARSVISTEEQCFMVNAVVV